MKVLFVVHDLSFAGHIAIAYLSAVAKQLDCPSVDAPCVGKGQYAFGDFLIVVEKGGSFDGAENLTAKNRKNPVRPVIGNPDKLPPADWNLAISNSFLKTAARKTSYTSNLCVHECYIKNMIFKLPEDYQRGPRLWK
jgi:hypothetical protein